MWRCAGAIALHAKLGYRVVVICLSYGERGEAAKLYADPGMTAAQGARRCARSRPRRRRPILGAEIEFFDGDDYILHTNEDMLDRAVAIMREVQVGCDPHPYARRSRQPRSQRRRAQFALQARMSAQAVGRTGGKAIGSPEIHGMTIGAPQVYSFEPHQSELCNFKPDTLLDITSVWEQKWAAIQCIESQPLMWEHYRNIAIQRGSVARGRPKYAEAFQRIFPSTVQELA